jgi:hypothetical protein
MFFLKSNSSRRHPGMDLQPSAGTAQHWQLPADENDSTPALIPAFSPGEKERR